MITAARSVLGKYAVFHGRAGRPEFWWWVLFVLLLLMVTNIVDALLVLPMLGLSPFAPADGQPVSFLASLALFVPNLAVMVRRLHDTGRTGWWVLIGLVPVIGTLVLLFFAVQRGDDGANAHGAPVGLPT